MCDSVCPPQTQFHLCHYVVCHDQDEFADPERFLPQRWLRPQGPGGRSLSGCPQHHPYSFIPFGVGVRACVGKRVAEMEMHFALSRVSGSGWRLHPPGSILSFIFSFFTLFYLFLLFYFTVCFKLSNFLSFQLMQHYEVQLEDEHTTVEPKTRTLLIPSRPINLRFLPRA